MEEQNTQTFIEQNTTGVQAVNEQKSVALQTIICKQKSLEIQTENEETSIGIQSVERQISISTQTVIEQKSIDIQTGEEQKSIGLQIGVKQKSIGLQIGEQKSIGTQTECTPLGREHKSVNTKSNAEQKCIPPRVNISKIRPIYHHTRRIQQESYSLVGVDTELQNETIRLGSFTHENKVTGHSVARQGRYFRKLNVTKYPSIYS